MTKSHSVISNKVLASLILDSVGFTTFVSQQTDNQTWIFAGQFTPTEDTLRDLFARWLSMADFDVTTCANGSKCITITSNF